MNSTTLSSSEARQEWSDLLGRAGYGDERFVITRNGTPIAAVIPIGDLTLLEEIEDRIDVHMAREALEEYRDNPDDVTSLDDLERELGLSAPPDDRAPEPVQDDA